MVWKMFYFTKQKFVVFSSSFDNSWKKIQTKIKSETQQKIINENTNQKNRQKSAAVTNTAAIAEISLCFSSSCLEGTFSVISLKPRLTHHTSPAHRCTCSPLSLLTRQLMHTLPHLHYTDVITNAHTQGLCLQSYHLLSTSPKWRNCCL